MLCPKHLCNINLLSFIFYQMLCPKHLLYAAALIFVFIIVYIKSIYINITNIAYFIQKGTSPLRDHLYKHINIIIHTINMTMS